MEISQETIPYRHRLIYYYPYGTSHLLEIFNKDIQKGLRTDKYNPQELKNKLVEDIIKCGKKRRNKLVKVVKALKKGDLIILADIFKNFDRFFDKNKKNQYKNVKYNICMLMSVRLSKELFNILKQDYESIQTKINRMYEQNEKGEYIVSDDELFIIKKEIKELIINMIQHAIYYEETEESNVDENDIKIYDYVINNEHIMAEEFSVRNFFYIIQSKTPNEIWDKNDWSDVWSLTDFFTKDWYNNMINIILSLYTTNISMKDIFPGKEPYTLTLPKEFILQRGTSHKISPDADEYQFHFNYSYFTTSIKTAMKYIVPWNWKMNGTSGMSSFEYCNQMGEIDVFQTQKELVLFDLSDVESVKNFQSLLQSISAPQNIINLFSIGWQIIENDGVEIFTRNSALNIDIEVVKWLCSKGYDGYIGRNIESWADEIMICNPSTCLHYIEKYSVNQLNMPMCSPPYSSLEMFILKTLEK